MKLELSETTLVDCLVVLKGIPEDEIKQVEAFSGCPFDVEDMAMFLMRSKGRSPMWTLRVIETKEPLIRS